MMMRIAIKRSLNRIDYAEYRYQWQVEVQRKPQHYWQPVFARMVEEGTDAATALYHLFTELGVAWERDTEHPMLEDSIIGSADGIILGKIAAII